MWVGSPSGSSVRSERWDSEGVGTPALSTSASRKPKRLQSAQFDSSAGAWKCRNCGYAYPGSKPHALQRREHKKVCPETLKDQQWTGGSGFVDDSGDSIFEGTSDASVTGTSGIASTSAGHSHAENTNEGRNSVYLGSEGTFGGEIDKNAPAGARETQISSQQEDSTGRSEVLAEIPEEVSKPGANEFPLKKSAKKDKESGVRPSQGAQQDRIYVKDHSGAESSESVTTRTETSERISSQRVDQKVGKVPTTIASDDVETVEDTQWKTRLKSKGVEKEDVRAGQLGISAIAGEKGIGASSNQHYHDGAEEGDLKTDASRAVAGLSAAERNWDEWEFMKESGEIVDEDRKPPLLEEVDRQKYCGSSEDVQIMEDERAEGIDDEKWVLVEPQEGGYVPQDSGHTSQLPERQLSAAEANWEDWDEVVRGGALLLQDEKLLKMGDNPGSSSADGRTL